MDLDFHSSFDLHEIYATIEASITYIKTLRNVDELFQNKGKNKIFGTDVN